VAGDPNLQGNQDATENPSYLSNQHTGKGFCVSQKEEFLSKEFEYDGLPINIAQLLAQDVCLPHS
jgi:hypothetical protein